MRTLLKPRHNLARLRSMLKLGQKELANMVGYSTRTIQSVELGTLALSESLARKISSETAVAVECLLENDLRAPVIGDDYKPFTVEHYNERRRLRALNMCNPSQTCAFVSTVMNTGNGNIEKPVTTRQLAEHLQITPRTLATYRAQRRIPFWHINSRQIRYRLSDVERALMKT